MDAIKHVLFKPAPPSPPPPKPPIQPSLFPSNVLSEEVLFNSLVSVAFVVAAVGPIACFRLRRSKEQKMQRVLQTLSEHVKVENEATEDIEPLPLERIARNLTI
jgi:hypothetical protein